MGSTLRKNRYFQTAVLDPNKRKPSLPSSHAMNKLTPIKIIVGADASEQRTWTLTPALLSRAPNLAALARNTRDESILLPDLDPRDFATYMLYLHSGIYTLNSQVPNFRPLHAATRAHLLGLRLHDSVYADAALRQIHAIFYPLSRLRTSNAAKSMIRASDIAYVGDRAVVRSGIRRLFVDGVASHWAQAECWGAGHVGPEREGEVKWCDVLVEYTDVKSALVRSRQVYDRWRRCLLLDVNEYRGKPEEKVWDGKSLHPDLYLYGPLGKYSLPKLPAWLEQEMEKTGIVEKLNTVGSKGV